MSNIQKHEKKLLDALDVVVGYVQDGVDPNTAIVKTARERGLSKDYITLLSRAYNTGRTLSQLQEGEVMDKSAEFPLADEAEIDSILYPTINDNTKVSSCYYDKPKYKSTKKKLAASIKLPPMTDKKAAPYEKDKNAADFKKLSQLRFRKRQIEDLRKQASQKFDKMAQTFNELVQYFRSPYSVSPTKVASVCQTIYGSLGEELIQNLTSHDPFILKCAHDNRQPIRYDDKPLTLIADFMQYTEEHGDCKRAYEIEKELLETEQRQEKEKQAALDVNSVLSKEFVIPEESNSTESKEASLLPALNMGMHLFGQAASGASSASDRARQGAQHQLGDLEPADHRRALHGIRAQAILADLLINDEELGGYDPDTVINAYNDLIQVAPEAANKKLLLQSALKQILAQGGLDKFDVKELAETEQAFTKVRDLKSELPKPSQKKLVSEPETIDFGKPLVQGIKAPTPPQ